ncbi:type II toxin-antitoxin system HicB family antitoxin [Streptomyces flavidovirens]|uniref:type II toxin-antitoxin system HicB family antitoxin n=1 Tax=Streptomyces flavidovirens TaxID=67298 RepID=UPI0004039477|nr:hypothetical protein [Streptomyces flavidovirens]
MTTGYEARLHRIGRWWGVEIPAVAIHTQCRTLDEAEGMARDAIAEARGIQPATVIVELVVPELGPLLNSVREARRPGAGPDAGQQALAVACRTLVEDLRVSQSDAGRLLGLPHQEVSRLSTPRGSADPRPWRGPQPIPSAPTPSAPAPVLPVDPPVSPTTRPTPPRQASPSRPAWAIAEDGA